MADWRVRRIREWRIGECGGLESGGLESAED